MRLKALDLFCGAGGAGMGLYRAGFDVTGVDIRPQPRYPAFHDAPYAKHFSFDQADALEFPLEYVANRKTGDFVCPNMYGYMASDHYEIKPYDFIWASPVCKGWTKAKSIHGHKEWYPMDQIASVREKLRRSGIPYVIENVVGAPLSNPFLLCGLMFGLKVLRHRHFEASFLMPQIAHPRHEGTTNSHRGMGKGGEYVCVAGHNFLMSEAKAAMGIDWMVQAEISQAIPPAYAEFIGHEALRLRSKAEGLPRVCPKCCYPVTRNLMVLPGEVCSGCSSVFGPPAILERIR